MSIFCVASKYEKYIFPIRQCKRNTADYRTCLTWYGSTLLLLTLATVGWGYVWHYTVRRLFHLQSRNLELDCFLWTLYFYSLFLFLQAFFWYSLLNLTLKRWDKAVYFVTIPWNNPENYNQFSTKCSTVNKMLEFIFIWNFRFIAPEHAVQTFQ